MKTCLLIATVAGVIALAGCASTVRSAQNLNPFTASTSFQHWDTNGDGVISHSEASQFSPLQQHFGTLDTNGNGVIDEAEYSAAMSHLSDRPAFDAYDLNDDGVITENEADSAPGGGLADIFDQVDADGDGNVSKTEFKAATANLLGSKNFNKIDNDGDGVISEDEAQASAPLLWQEFDRVDVNGDDQISKQEYQSFQQRGGNNQH